MSLVDERAFLCILYILVFHSPSIRICVFLYIFLYIFVRYLLGNFMERKGVIAVKIFLYYYILAHSNEQRFIKAGSQIPGEILYLSLVRHLNSMTRKIWILSMRKYNNLKELCLQPWPLISHDLAKPSGRWDLNFAKDFEHRVGSKCSQFP